MQNEKIMTRLEAEIAIKELKELKKKVAFIKRSEEAESTTANSILSTSIEDMNLSVHSYNCLKIADINTVGELVCLSEEEFTQVRNIGKKPYEEIMAKIRKMVAFNPEIKIQVRIQAEIRKREEILDFEMSKKLLSAIEIYARIRTKAKEEGILFSALGRYSKFSYWYRGSINGIREILDEGKGIIGRTFLQRILNGEFPKMKELLDAETINLDLATAAIFEDVVSCYSNKQTNTYQQILRFVKLIQEYSE